MGNKQPGVLLSKNLLADRWGKGKGGVGHQVDNYVHTAHSCELNIQEVAFLGTGRPVLCLVGSLYEYAGRSRVYLRAAVLLKVPPAARSWEQLLVSLKTFREVSSGRFLSFGERVRVVTFMPWDRVWFFVKRV